MIFRNCYKFICLLTFLVLLSACRSKANLQKEPSYKFSELNVEQINNDGIKQFIFKTKKAMITESNGSVLVNSPSLQFYHQKRPYYNITAKEGSIFNNGERIELIDNVLLQSVVNNNFFVQITIFYFTLVKTFNGFYIFFF